MGYFNGIEKHCTHFRKEVKTKIKSTVHLPQYTLQIMYLLTVRVFELLYKLACHNDLYYINIHNLLQGSSLSVGLQSGDGHRYSMGYYHGDVTRVQPTTPGA